MPEKKQKKRNSVPAQRAQDILSSVPERPSTAQLPNSARASLMGQDGGGSDALLEKFAQHRLPSEERESSVMPELVDEKSQLDDEGIRQQQGEQDAGQAQQKNAMRKPNFFARAYAAIRDKTFGRMSRSRKRALDDIMEHKLDGSYYNMGAVNRILYAVNNPLAVMQSWGNKEKWKARHDAKMQAEQDRIAQYRADNNVQALNHDSYDWGADHAQEEARVPGAAEKEPAKIVGNATYAPSISISDTLFKDVSRADAVLKLDKIKDHPVAKWLTSDKQFLPENMMEKTSIGDASSMLGSAMKGIKGIKGVADSFSNMNKSMKTGLAEKKTNSVLGIFSSLFSTARLMGTAAGKIGAKFQKLLPEKVANALTWGTKPFWKLFGEDFNHLNVMGVASSGANVLKGTMTALSGLRTKLKLGDVKTRVQNEPLENDEKVSLNKLMRQAGSAANQRLIDGVGGMFNGAAGMANSITLKGLLGVGAKMGGRAVEKLTGLASGAHQGSMDKKVLKEDMPELDDQIEAYARELAVGKGLDPENVGAREQRRLKRQAKHIILKAHGFSSGKRSEAVAFFNTARAKYLAKRANRQQEGVPGDDIARSLVDAIGVNRRGDKFHEDDIAERLGRKRKQENVIASRSSNIEALNQKKNKGFWNNTKRFFGWMFS